MIGELARRFVGAAHRKRRIAAFIPTTARFAHEGVKYGLSAVKVGAAPYFDLQTWTPRGDRAKKMRSGVNQAHRAGVSIETVEVADEKIRRETATLCRHWLETRRTATNLGWLFVLDPFQHAESKRFFAARDVRGRLVGFLAASHIPARAGWYLEDILRLPDAPPGVPDLLVVEALKRLAAGGAKLATLGASPLAQDGGRAMAAGGHPLTERMLHLAATRLENFYNFEGLRRFKSKFAPSWWESEYVLVPRGVTVPPRVTYAFTRAIMPGGLAQLITRQIVRKLKIRRDEDLKIEKYEG